MRSENIMAHIRPGMKVEGSDGRTVGKIRQVWLGSDPQHSHERCDEDECSRLEVHHGPTTVYVPYNAIAQVTGKVVRLTVDTPTVDEKGWYRKPLWIPQAEARNIPPLVDHS